MKRRYLKSHEDKSFHKEDAYIRAEKRLKELKEEAARACEMMLHY